LGQRKILIGIALVLASDTSFCGEYESLKDSRLCIVSQGELDQTALTSDGYLQAGVLRAKRWGTAVRKWSGTALAGKVAGRFCVQRGMAGGWCGSMLMVQLKGVAKLRS